MVGGWRRDSSCAEYSTSPTQLQTLVLDPGVSESGFDLVLEG